MSTDRAHRAAKAAALLYPIVTVLTLVLTFVVFMVWLALVVYSLIRVLSDVLSGQHRKEQNFLNTLDSFVQNTGSSSKAMAYFTAMVIASSLLKLAVPVVLWAVFR